MLAFFSLLLVLGFSAAGVETAAIVSDSGYSDAQDKEAVPASRTTRSIPESQARIDTDAAASREAAIKKLTPRDPNLNERDGYTEAFAAAIDTEPFEPAPRKKRYRPGAPLNL